MDNVKCRAWNGTKMDYDYRDVSLWHGMLVAEGDTLLMLSIGSPDRNGKDIFKSDILRKSEDGFELTLLVEGGFTADGMTLFLASHNGQKTLFTKSDEFEVIGNRYENPELLEVSA